jgi:hypothetical protein
VPLALAAPGPAGMRLAARYATTRVTTGDRELPAPGAPTVGAGLVASQIARLEEACAAVARDPTTIGRLVLLGPELVAGTTSEQAYADVLGAYEAVGVTDVVVAVALGRPPAGRQSGLQFLERPVDELDLREHALGIDSRWQDRRAAHVEPGGILRHGE